MGKHNVCSEFGRGHKFAYRHNLDVVYDELDKDYFLSGICECGRWRIIKYRDLISYYRNNKDRW